MRPEQGPPVALSTASVYPEPVAAGFELAAELGYDAVELMVWGDRVSQDVAAVGKLAERHGVPVIAVHAPCLAVTQRVWGADPIVRIRRSVAAAQRLGATTVVLHPPFRWQRRYAAEFAAEVARAGEYAGVALAVENMYPVVRGNLRTVPYSPGFDPTDVGHEHYTLDLSHTAAAGSDALAMLDRMGAGLAHVHLADGSGAPRDEHLVPGRGNQPCAEVCERLADNGFDGVVVLEVSTRRCRTRYERAALLAESLLFARLHLKPTAGEDHRPPQPTRPEHQVTS
jgi:sugar phosphate isomerase/epimerase